MEPSYSDQTVTLMYSIFYSDSGDTEIEGSGIFSEAVTDATFSEEEGLYHVLVYYTIEEQDILSPELSKVKEHS